MEGLKKNNEYFSKFLCQFRDISAENRPSKFH